ncbi:MAG: divalent-cation tolerance protein CutA [Terriglobales bacterium]|jgi:periplasmic divalent cation tolerance protein
MEGTNFGKWMVQSASGASPLVCFADKVSVRKPDPMTGKKILLTTAGSPDEARKIAHALVERRLAACVNIIPEVQSVYRWKEKVEQAQEWMLVIKTTSEAFTEVKAAIKELHSYELPECICFEIEDGSPEYLKWIGESVG